MKIQIHSDSTRSVLSANLMAQSEDSRPLILESNSADQLTRSVSALLRCLCAFFLIIGIHVTSVAEEVVIFGASHIGPEGDSRLHRINPLTGAAAAVGPGIGFQRVSGMDFDPATGILYATGEREAGVLDVNVLMTINPRTGVGTEIGPTGVVDFLGLFSGDPNFEGVFSDLSFRPSDNTLFGFSFPGQWVATINLATGEATQLAFETVNGDRGIEANSGNALAFLDSALVHAGSTSPLDTAQPPSCAPDCFSALHEINLGTNLATTSVALDFPFVAGFDNDFAVPRANGMDFHSASETLFASIVYSFFGNRATFLGTIDPTSGAVDLIGETELGMDALAVISSADINSNTINFRGQLAVVDTDIGGAIYSGVPVGTEFFGEIDDVTFSGFISDGTTVTEFNCCLEPDGGSLFVDNDEILDADDATLINSLAGTSFVAGDFLDFIILGGSALTSGGSQIAIELVFVLDSDAIDDNSLDNYPPNPDDILITVFVIAELRSGLTISFDTFDNLGSDAIAIDVLVNGVLVGRNFTNPFTDGSFVPVSVVFDADGTLDLTFDGSPIFVDLPTGFTPMGSDRFGFGGRTGALNEVNRIDNVSISACRDTFGCPPPDAEYINDFSASVGPASLFGDAVLDSGSVRLTDSINEQLGSLVINDLVPGGAVASFAATFDLQMGPGSVPPADGISFNLGLLPDSAFGEDGSDEEATIYEAFGVVDDFDFDGDGVPGSIDNCPFTANPSQADNDLDGTGDACDLCINDFGPPDNAGCPRPEVPPRTAVENLPSGCDIVVDGQFGSNACIEWADTTPVVTLGGDSIIYQALDPDGRDLYLMYDFIGSQTPLAVGEESGVVRFFVDTDVFDVFFIQGGPSGTLGLNDDVRVLKNGVPFDNSLGSIAGAVDFNNSSPNFADPHNLFELEVVLLQTPDTPGGSASGDGGLYSPDPAFWGAALPGSPLVEVSASIIDIQAGGNVIALVVSNMIDIKPGSDPNAINTKSMGVVPVAILGSETFDIADVDVTTLAFGPAFASSAHNLLDPAVLASHLQDVNSDAFTDLVSHYRQKLTGLAPGDMQACIEGQTIGGEAIFGCDNVNIVK